MSWPRAALLSLSDKTGAAEFARALTAHETTILASGGTAKHLESAGIRVTPLERWTGFSELAGGRVKTLHPHIHAAILARRSVAEDMSELAARKLTPIDLVAVSLYPFEEKAPALDDAAMLEEIDIGGVALLRAAAKNHRDVVVVHSPAQYGEVIDALQAGSDDLAHRRAWARAAFIHTARYDATIAGELARRADATHAPLGGAAESGAPPAYHLLALERVRALRYGENPDQPAALYARVGHAKALETWREGKELSYNNLLDLEAAVRLAGAFEEPACVIVKHGQPCGAACAATAAEAWSTALRADELSAFGGIAAFNRPLDREAAEAMAKVFVECVAAPQVTLEADVALRSRRNLRVLVLTEEKLRRSDPWDVRLVGDWALLQRDAAPEPEWRVVTARRPSAEEEQGLRFAWKVAGAARSNAVAIARGTALLGLGAGQTSRVDAVDVAILKARRSGHHLLGAVLASDGFFPFADNIEHAAQAGVTAFVQPGGSVKDADVIAACDARGLAMMVTGRRVFRH